MKKITSEIINGVPTVSGNIDDITNAFKNIADKYKLDGRRIKKAKLTSLSYLEVEYSETVELTDDSIRSEKSQKCFWDVHNDLKLQFDRLIPHLALMCELIEESQLDGEFSHPSFYKYKVTGYVIGGEDEHEGVTIIGRKTLAGNRVLNLITPFTKWEDEHNGYRYSNELKSIITDCESEVLAYLDGKRAPSAQQELPFED